LSVRPAFAGRQKIDIRDTEAIAFGASGPAGSPFAALALPVGGAMKSILDPSFQYVPSASTDIRRTFERVRREMAEAGTQRGARAPSARGLRVVPIQPAKAGKRAS
jgi:hypothetical protein